MDWLKNLWEWVVPGEDDKGILKNLFGSDDEGFTEETWADTGIGSLEDLDTMFPTTDVDWNSILGEAWGYDDYTDYTTNLANSLSSEEDEDLTFLQKMGVGEDYDTPQWLKVIGDILGIGGSKEGERQGILGLLERGAEGIGGGVGGILESPLGQLALLNYMKNKDEAARDIPMGQQAYGSSDVYGNVGAPDYRVTNLQPALMPGVAYANVAQPETPPPPMRHGGIAGLASPEGPGDITLAKLEPGEFVMTKKATDNIGAQNLYRMMKQAEGGI